MIFCDICGLNESYTYTKYKDIIYCDEPGTDCEIMLLQAMKQDLISMEYQRCEFIIIEVDFES